MAEWDVDLAIVAEPYWVPPRSDWRGDTEGLVAIINGGGSNAQPFTQLGKGKGYTVVKWGTIIVVGVYFSPNSSLQQFERYLNELCGDQQMSLRYDFAGR